MPSIKGITIEIAGNTSQLVKSLDEAQKATRQAQNQVKDLERALKKAPDSLEGWQKQQELINKAIAETEKRLQAEQAAAEEAKKALELGDISQSQYDQFEVQIIKTNAQLEELKNKATQAGEAVKTLEAGGSMQTSSASIQDTHDKVELLTKGLEAVSSAGEKAGDVLSAEFEAAKRGAELAAQGVEKLVEVSAQAVAKTGEISYDLSRAVVENYGSYQQLVGGVEKIFESSADTVIENADRAYRTAGVSANDYLETITGFSASLLQGLGGDTEEAARIADMALSDMSDNANTYGTDLSAIMEVYQGLAKGTYTTLDNLRLGYGGTKTELIRLINDSGILEERISSLDGITFDQMIEAIHAVQDEMHITGTTSREATTTIQGSLGMLKASWTNFLTALGRPDVDIDAYAEELTDSLETVSNNLKPVIRRISSSLPGLLPPMVDDLREEIPDVVSVVGEIMNAVASAAAEAAPEVIDVAMENLPEATEIITSIIRTLSSAIDSNTPQLLEASRQILPAFTQLGAEVISVIIQGAIENAPEAAQVLADSLGPVIADALGEEAAEGFRESLNKIVENAPDALASLTELTSGLLSTLAEHGPAIIDALSFAAEHLPGITNALVVIAGLGKLADVGIALINIGGALSQIGVTLPGIQGVGTSLTGVGTAATGAGTAATGAAASLSSIAATAGPIALLAAEIVALGVEVKTYIDLMGEAEEAGISWSEATIGGALQAFDTMSPLGQLIGTDLAGAYYEAQRAADDSFQTIDQQAQQAAIDIQLAIENSGAAATASVADDCQQIQAYLDNLEANGQVELRARVITEYQTVMTRAANDAGDAARASYYSTQGRRRNTAAAYAASPFAQADREMADRYRQQGEAALQAIEDTAKTAQETIRTGGYGGGGGGGGGSSKKADEESALTASKAEELLTSIDSHITEALKYLGLLSEPSEYQQNVNQMIDGVLKALETGYTDQGIETAKAQLQETMAAYGMAGSPIDATTLEQLRGLVNAPQTEAFTQVQGSVAAIQAATADYTPRFMAIESLMNTLVALKQSETDTINVYIGNEQLSSYIQQMQAEQQLVSGGVA